MKDEPGFRDFLKQRGRKSRVVDEIVGLVAVFADFVQDQYRITLEDATPDHMHDFAVWIGSQPSPSDKKYCWAIAYYFGYIGRPDMVEVANAVRAEKTKRRLLSLKEFTDIDEEDLAALAALEIKYADQMLHAGRTPIERENLAQRSGVALAVIEHLVRLCDLSRIHGVKNTRATLYIGAGFDTLDKLAAADPAQLRAITGKWIAQTGFNGVPPTPKEASSTVAAAADLSRIVEY